MPEISANLTDEELKTLLDLAQQRGVDANTVLKQAIATEALISRNVGKQDDLLIRKPDDSLSKIVFE